MRLLILLLLFINITTLQAQKYDNTWVFGDIWSNPSTKDGCTMTFDSSGVSITPINISCSIKSNASYCDDEGQLIAYSDGCRMYNINHKVMKNGDSVFVVLKEGYQIKPNCDTSSQFYNGYPGNQSILFLPFPGDSTKAVFLHINQFPLQAIFYQYISYAVIDINRDNGLGEVVEKNVKLPLSSNLEAQMSAVRHANGRDWWILVFRKDVNIHYSFLLSPDGINGPFQQFVGIDMIYPNSGRSFFSPDGEKYVRVSAYNHIEILDFDRCTGALSHSLWMKWPYETVFLGCKTAFPPTSAGAFSANSRFLYVCFEQDIFQYDLWSDDIEQSRIKIAGGNFYYRGMARGPDGKIYIFRKFGNKENAVINKPNKKGLDCDFDPFGLILPIYTFGTSPNYPNLRLGKIEGSACDTIP